MNRAESRAGYASPTVTAVTFCEKEERKGRVWMGRRWRLWMRNAVGKEKRREDRCRRGVAGEWSCKSIIIIQNPFSVWLSSGSVTVDPDFSRSADFFSYCKVGIPADQTLSSTLQKGRTSCPLCRNSGPLRAQEHHAVDGVCQTQGRIIPREDKAR